MDIKAEFFEAYLPCSAKATQGSSIYSSPRQAAGYSAKKNKSWIVSIDRDVYKKVYMKKKLIRILLSLLVLALIIFLPIVPVLKAAVVPHPVYTFDFASLFYLFNPFIVGISYKFAWYSTVTFLLLIIFYVGFIWFFIKTKKNN
jgi:hypothetical protein